MSRLQAEAHAEPARELAPGLGAQKLDERHQAFDGEREELYAGERPPEREPEPARRTA